MSLTGGGAVRHVDDTAAVFGEFTTVERTNTHRHFHRRHLKNQHTHIHNHLSVRRSTRLISCSAKPRRNSVMTREIKLIESNKMWLHAVNQCNMQRLLSSIALAPPRGYLLYFSPLG